MNKNLFKTFAIAAMTVLAGACAKENEQLAGPSNVTFEVSTPEIATKAIGDGMTATKLYYQVFDADGKAIEGLGVQNKDLASGKTTVSFQLIKDQTYNFIFWAQTAEAGYYIIDEAEGLKKITADYTTHKGANDENRDAFFAVEKSLKITGPVSKNIELKRPFAQVNIATVGSYKVGEKEKAIDFSEAKSSVKFVSIPTLFTPLETEQVSVNKTTNFATAEIPEGNVTLAGQSYKYMAMNYIFASEEGSVYDITATLKVGGKSYNVSVPNAPLKRNWRTNIVGDFLTSSAEFNVVVTPNFEENGDETIDLNNIKTETELNAALATYGAANISNDIQVTSQLSPKGNKTIKIESGGSISPSPDMRKDLSEVIYLSSGTLTLEGEGKIVGQSEGTYGFGSEAITVAGGTLNIKGNLKVEAGGGSVKADRAVYVRSGTANIYGGYFHTMDDVEGKPNPVIFLNPDWKKTANCNIYGGVFESAGKPEYIVNIEDSGRARAIIKIYGGTFVGFNPADNIAEGAHTNFVAEGYKAVETTYEGKQAWKVEAIPPVTTQEGLNAAIADVAEGETATVYLEAGEYDFIKKDCKGDIVVKGKDKTTTIVRVPNESRGYDNKSISFENITLNCENTYINDGRESQFPRTDLHFTNCNINGLFAAIGPTTTSFKECTFTASDYAIKYYGGDKSSKLIVDKCQFNTHGKGILMFNEGAYVYDAEIINCTFEASAVIKGKAAIQMHTERGIKGKLSITNSSATGFDSSINGGLWNEVNNDTKDHTTNFNVTVDGTPVQTAK